MKKIKLLIVILFAFLLFVPLVGCSHDSSSGSDEGNGSYTGGGSRAQHLSSSPMVFIWISESGETFIFYDDGTYYYDGDPESWGTYKEDIDGNLTLTADDGSGFYFEISDGSATVYETENGKKKEGSEGTSFKEINPSYCTVAEAAKYISTLTEDKPYTVIVFDEKETSCSALKTALNGLSSTESVGPYVSLDLTGATKLSFSDSKLLEGNSSGYSYALREIILPENCTSIVNYAFRYQAGLQNVVFPKSLTSIGQYAFRYCTSLTSIDLADTNVTEIKYEAFAYCTQLANIKLSKNLTKIGDVAFFRCSSLKSIELPSSLITLGAYVFSECTSLATIDLSNTNVTEFPDGRNGTPYGVFYGCTNLTSIKLPDTLEKIGDYAFYKCTSLTSIDLSDINVTEIDFEAFCGCSSLNTVTMTKTEGMAWGHSKKIGLGNSVDEPLSECLDMVEDFEDYAAYYLTGNSSAKGNGTPQGGSSGCYYYWYKVTYAGE